MSSADAPPNGPPSVGVASPTQHQPSTPGQASIQPVQQSIPTEALTCQWTGCGERCSSPEALYDHVCERHVGRKSTNNLNLTCQWGNCRTTTVKRDHITSHIRVHVPLKPHKCDFCGKAFKRPQDLKKHVKTHADDSVLLRSPEPGRPHPGSSGYAGPKQSHLAADLQSLAATASGYYPDGSNLGPTYGYQHAASNPPSQFQPSAPQNSYGQVYYTVNSSASLGADYEIRKRAAFDALNEFFGDAKRRLIDPTTYYDVGQRLMAINSVPSILGGYPASGASMSEYHSGGGLATASHGSIAQHQYSLPLPNLRTKNDLLNVDQFLDQLQSTVYESPSVLEASGVQGGSHVVHPIMNFRHSHSPPTMRTDPQSGHANNGVSPANSATEETPALTPASSTMSYTSGQSPTHSQNISPTTATRPSDGPMYPTLPSFSTMANQYGATSSAPASGLASAYDPADGRRRWSGGQLQKVAPSTDQRMSPSSDATASPKQPSDSRRSSAETISIDKEVREKLALVSPGVASTNLDPALRSPAQNSESSDQAHDKAQESWVENIRCIEALRHFIKTRLERGEFEEEEGTTESKGSPRDTEMGDADAQSLYPVLRAVQES